MSQSSVASSFATFVRSPTSGNAGSATSAASAASNNNNTTSSKHHHHHHQLAQSNSSSRSSLSGTPSPGPFANNSSSATNKQPSKSPLSIQIASPPLGAKNISANLLTMPSASTPTSVSSGATPASIVPSTSSPSKTSGSPQPGATTNGAASSTPCCETGRVVFTDPITGQSICSCQYDAHILNYQRLAASAGLPMSMYGPAAMAAAAAAAAYANGSAPTPPGGCGPMPPTSSAPSSIGPPTSGAGNTPLTGALAPHFQPPTSGPGMPPTSGGQPGDTGAFLPLSPEQLQSAAAAAAAAAPFFPPSANGFDLKESVDMWRNLNPAAYTAAAAASMYYPYDGAAAAAAAGLAGYPFASGYGMDLNGARRKNATRETTSTLKAWLSEHRKNPYPTKGEKIMLAIITKMTLTQVSTWFANARRRLKKENKMTWSPRNRCDDDDDDDDDKDGGRDDDSDIVDIEEEDSEVDTKMPMSMSMSMAHHHASMAAKFRMEGNSPLSDLGSLSDSDRLFSAGKPRIWSIVDTATSQAVAAAQQAQQQVNNQNSGNSSSSSLSPSGTKSPGSSIGPISPSNAHRHAARDYASPYSKPQMSSIPSHGSMPPHSLGAGAMPPHMPQWPYSAAAAAAAAAAAFGAAGSPGFSPLYGCPPGLMSQLMGAGGPQIPSGPPAGFPPHLMESSLNRLRNAAVAAAAAASNGNPGK